MPKPLIVAICACPAGIAHTYIVADKFENTAKRLGYEAKVETQGFVGIENRLTKEDLDQATLIFMCNDIAISEMERFDSYQDKIVYSSMHEALHDSQQLIESNLRKKGY